MNGGLMVLLKGRGGKRPSRRIIRFSVRGIMGGQVRLLFRIGASAVHSSHEQPSRESPVTRRCNICGLLAAQ